MSDAHPIAWRIRHRAETASTNLDARAGTHGDVFTADYQTAGRGRLDHKWLSPSGTNLMMSAVLSVEGIPPDRVATLPLVAGLAVAKAVANIVSAEFSRPSAGSLLSAVRCADKTVGCYHAAQRGRCVYGVSLKWPNDVLVGGKKIAGILCERHGDNVIVGIGVNVGQTEFDKEIADRATSLRLLVEHSEQSNNRTIRVTQVRNAVLGQLGKWYGIWREGGFAAVYPEIAALDFLRGKALSVLQTDDDSIPLSGVSNGIMPDGALDVGGTRVYAGEAHVEQIAEEQR